MDPALRRAWTEIVTPDDYEEHMSAVGQAQAAAELTGVVLRSAAWAPGARVVIAGAGTGQTLDFLDPGLLRPYQLTLTDLNPLFLSRLRARLVRHGLTATVMEDDIERTAISPGPDLLMTALLLEHIDWRRGVESFAGLQPRMCAVIIQENPPGMSSAVTPGRRVPPSIGIAMESAHATLVPRRELIAAFDRKGYRCRETHAREVADGKQLIAVLFTPGSVGSAVE